MTSTVPEPGLPPTATSEAAADRGCVYASATRGGRRYMLSEADGWREGDTYVIRSTEFDIMAEDESFERALDMFVTWLVDRAAQLAELVGADEATEDEARMFAALSARVFPLLRAVENRERRVNIRRRRRTGIWRHRGTPASTSGQLSAA